MVAWKRQLILFGGFHESTRLVPVAGHLSLLPGTVGSGLLGGRTILSSHGRCRPSLNQSQLCGCSRGSLPPPPRPRRRPGRQRLEVLNSY